MIVVDNRMFDLLQSRSLRALQWETTSMIDKDTARLLTFERPSDMRSRTRNNKSKRPLPLSARPPTSDLNPTFLENLTWLAAHHPHAIQTLEDTAAKMVTHYKLTDTVVYVLAWSVFGIG
jgi:hypothetical protein